MFYHFLFALGNTKSHIKIVLLEERNFSHEIRLYLRIFTVGWCISFVPMFIKISRFSSSIRQHSPLYVCIIPVHSKSTHDTGTHIQIIRKFSFLAKLEFEVTMAYTYVRILEHKVLYSYLEYTYTMSWIHVRLEYTLYVVVHVLEYEPLC